MNEQKQKPNLLELLWIAGLMRANNFDVHEGQATIHDDTLRQMQAQLLAGHTVGDVWAGAPEEIRSAISTVARQLPETDGGLREAMQNISQKMKLREIDAQLSDIAKSAASMVDEANETEVLKTMRIDLLRLRKQVIGQ